MVPAIIVDQTNRRLESRSAVTGQPTSCPWCKPTDIKLVEFVIKPSAPSAQQEGEQ
jgi:hypothetical protein